MKKFWARKVIGIIIIVIAAITLLSYIVMCLWNCTLVPVLGVKAITYTQALGILILSKILFGGFKGRHGGHHEWKHKMREKWGNMTPEEREKFRQEWKNKCRGGWRRGGFEEPKAGTE